MNSQAGSSETGMTSAGYDHFMTGNEKFHEIIVPEELLQCKSIKPENVTEVSGVFGREKMVAMMRQKLLEHKWGDAALIMSSLSALPVSTHSQLNDMFWKVGNEILYNHPATKHEFHLVLQHRQASRTQCFETDGAHILYEYVLYLLVQKDFQGAREVLNFYRVTLRDYNKRKKDPVVLKAWLDDWSPVYEGYLGVLDYLSWKEMAADMEARFSFAEDDNGPSPRDVVAEEAVKHFETTLSSPGVWDIFVGKYVELLESLGRIVEAEEALRTNSLKYPKNPNAHKYWYEFLLRHPELEEHKASCIDALSKLHEVAPSDSYMCDLHNLRMETAFSYEPESTQFLSMASMALEIMMDMLDYNSWVTHDKYWKTLAKSLKRAKSEIDSKKFDEILNTIWLDPMRNTWWPRYHFSVGRAKEALKLSPNLAKSKSSVAAVLLGSKCDFCKRVKKG